MREFNPTTAIEDFQQCLKRDKGVRTAFHNQLIYKSAYRCLRSGPPTHQAVAEQDMSPAAAAAAFAAAAAAAAAADCLSFLFLHPLHPDIKAVLPSHGERNYKTVNFAAAAAAAAAQRAVAAEHSLSWEENILEHSAPAVPQAL
eukprot:1161079-Pelagomonas_calceolata.AAC.11